MGYIRHHAILVTSCDPDLINEAHQEALRIFGQALPMGPPAISSISSAPVNQYQSFAVFPDGSKEGWETSDQGDERRATFIWFLNTKRWEDGSSSISWVEVQYGDEEHQSYVVNHSDDPINVSPEAELYPVFVEAKKKST